MSKIIDSADSLAITRIKEHHTDYNLEKMRMYQDANNITNQDQKQPLRKKLNKL